MTTKQTNKLDKLFSEKIRSRAKCEWCDRTGLRLETAHIFSRRFRGTRWDGNNALCLCSACHRQAHDRPTEFTDFVKSRLGEMEYNRLKLESYKLAVYINYEDILKEVSCL